MRGAREDRPDHHDGGEQHGGGDQQVGPGTPEQRDHEREDEVEERLARERPADGVAGLPPVRLPRADEERVGDDRLRVGRADRGEGAAGEEQGGDQGDEVHGVDPREPVAPEGRGRPARSIAPRQDEAGEQEEQRDARRAGAEDGGHRDLRLPVEVARVAHVVGEDDGTRPPSGGR
ncbi:hypothetical protein ABID70_002889 [Clavibacter michiganensis]